MKIGLLSDINESKEDTNFTINGLSIKLQRLSNIVETRHQASTFGSVKRHTVGKLEMESQSQQKSIAIN